MSDDVRSPEEIEAATQIKDALRGKDRRPQLEAMRDLVIADLMSDKAFLRGGDRAALYKRLQDILEAIEQLGDEENPVADETEEILNRRKVSGASNVIEFEFGKKTSKRRSSGEKRRTR